MAQDYYKTLDVSRTATTAEIQKAYRKLARKYHPDLNPDDKAAQQRFKEIQLAYDCLNDPEKRKLYDQFGDQYENVAAGRAAGGQPGGFNFNDVFGGGGPGGFHFEGDLGDLFRQFGGAAAGAGAGARGRRGRTASVKGNDMSVDLTVPFNTAVLGGQATISIQRGRSAEHIQVKVPAGVETGSKIRLRGQGEASTNGGEAGDLLVTLTVASHPFFKRSCQNLELRLPVTLGEATLGATIDLPTPGGTVSLKIPPSSSSGRRLRVKGQGVRDQRGQAGDLIVEILIKLPEQLDDESRKAIAHIEQLYREQPRQGIVW